MVVSALDPCTPAAQPKLLLLCALKKFHAEVGQGISAEDNSFTTYSTAILTLCRDDDRRGPHLGEALPIHGEQGKACGQELLHLQPHLSHQLCPPAYHHGSHVCN